MSAGYQTLHVGKNGALALAAITGWQVFMPLVPLWSIIECSLHLNWYSVTWCGCGIQVPLCFCSSSVLFEGENFLHRLQLCYLDS